MIPGHSAGAATLHMNKDKLSQNSGNGNNGEERRRRVSVMNSTRNLMAYLKKDRSRSNMQTKAVTDPIDRFLRKVDTTKFMHKSADGFELDDEDGYVPQVLQCQLKGHTCIFLPSAPGRLVWDVLIAVMIIYYLFMVPLRIAFDIHNSEVDALTGQGFWLGLDILFDLLFLFDIFINFRTAYIVAGELETKSTKICQNYLKGWFLMDMVASIPTTIITSMAGGSDLYAGGFDPKFNTIFRAFKWFKLIKLIRVMRLSRVFDRLEHITMFWNAGTLRLVRSVAILFVLWHVVACMYWVVSSNQGFCEWHLSINASYARYNEWDYVSGSEPNGFQDCYDDWVPWKKIQSEPFSTQYAQAFFWAVMVTTGVGKDINPQSQVETAFTIAVIAIGIIAYALVIGSLSSAIQSMDHKSHIHNQQLERITHFMNFNKVPHYMQLAIKQYYEYKWSRPDTDIPVSDLPSILKIRLKVLLNRDALHAVPVFRELPADCVIALTQHIKSQTVFPSEFSIHQGQKNTNIYIIRHGRMRLTRHPKALDGAKSAKDKWKALLHRWSQNNKAKNASLANLAVTAYRDAYLMTVEKHSEEEFVMELGRSNFYGVNCLLPYQAPEDFSCSAITFSDVLVLDTGSRAMKMIIEEYPIMQRKLSNFALERRRRIQKQFSGGNSSALKKTKSMFGGTPSRKNSEDGSDPDSASSKYAVSPKHEESVDIAESGDAPGRRLSLSGQENTKDLMKGGVARANNGMGALLRQFAKAAVDQEKLNNSATGMAAAAKKSLERRPSMAREEMPVNSEHIRKLEQSISDLQQIQLAQFESISEKMEEILSNMYV